MRVHVWSDVVCPWCAVGKAHLEAALARFEHADSVQVVWRSFQLDPGAPAARDGEYAAHLARRYGTSTAGGAAMARRISAAVDAAGIPARFDRVRPANTFDAHRLLHLALERGLQDPLKERLDAATFGEGLSVSDHDALTALAVEVGLDEAEVREVLASDRYADAVRRDEAQAQAYGITGVPFFVVDGTYGVSGAQPAELLVQVLDKAWSESTPLLVTTGGGEACAGDSCAV